MSNDRTFIGHSYGGLFGTFILLTQPDLFGRYVIISPSLWFDNGSIMKLENQQVLRRAIHARAFFAVGSLETKAATGAPMVQELTHFAEKLKAQRNVNFEVTLDVRQGETHASIFPCRDARPTHRVSRLAAQLVAKSLCPHPFTIASAARRAVITHDIKNVPSSAR